MLTFADILDQSSAVRTLVRAYQAERLPHGVIFAGPMGVGKATTARALGNVFLCDQPVEREVGATGRIPVPCGKCPACRVSEAKTHPDYHVIVKELIRYHDRTGKSKGIDLSLSVVRPELIEAAGRKSNLGRGKVFLIEQAELMTNEAQNAILKTLEEPAGRTIIILLTDQPSQLLPTIRSRCQVIRFSPLPRETVRARLQQRGIEPEMIDAASELASGSLGLALKWIEDGVVTSGLELQRLIGNLGSGRHAQVDLAGWFKSAADAYATRQLERDSLGSKDQATREGLALYLTLASEVFRQRLAAEQDPDALERACAAIDALVRAEQYLDANVNIPLIFQQLQLALAAA